MSLYSIVFNVQCDLINKKIEFAVTFVNFKLIELTDSDLLPSESLG